MSYRIGPECERWIVCAISVGSKSCLKRLIQWGGSRLINLFAEGATPLYHAISAGNMDVIAYLVDEGADLHICGKYEGAVSPLEHAFECVRLDTISLFLEVEPNCRDLALMFARKHGDQALIDHVANWSPGLGSKRARP